LFFSYITKAIKTASSDNDTLPISGLTPNFKPAFTPIHAEFPTLPDFSTVASEIYLKTNNMIECLEILMTDLMVSTIISDDSFIPFLSDMFEDIAAALMNSLMMPLCDAPVIEAGVNLSSFKEDMAEKGLKCLLGLLKFS
jgi:hypothetical protein